LNYIGKLRFCQEELQVAVRTRTMLFTRFPESDSAVVLRDKGKASMGGRFTLVFFEPEHPLSLKIPFTLHMKHGTFSRHLTAARRSCGRHAVDNRESKQDLYQQEV
jgi:hypothetical protein